MDCWSRESRFVPGGESSLSLRRVFVISEGAEGVDDSGCREAKCLRGGLMGTESDGEQAQPWRGVGVLLRLGYAMSRQGGKLVDIWHLR